MAGKNATKDPKNQKNWDKKDLVEVIIADTGVQTVVCRGYAEAYKTEGVVYLRDYKPETPKKATVSKEPKE